MTARGNPIHQAYADRLRAERLAQHAHVRCLWCKWNRQGTVAETRALFLEHRALKHPEIQPKPRKQRGRPFQTMITKKPLDENIANARLQGASTWDGATE